MKQLILVRYGQYEDCHLTEEGVETMSLATERLLSFVLDKKVRILAAETERAIESAQIIGNRIIKPVEIYEELYAAEEEGNTPDLEQAKNLLLELGRDCDVIVAVVSREYIESLPGYLLDEEIETSLNRGECLVINFETKEILYLKQ